MKALELLLFGFPEDIKLLDHFFRSYQKNYTFDVVGISEVDEPSTSEYFEEQSKNKMKYCVRSVFQKRNEKDSDSACGPVPGKQPTESANQPLNEGLGNGSKTKKGGKRGRLY